MSPEDRDRRLVSTLENYHRRRALGEAVAADDYREKLGDLFNDFVTLVERSDEIDRAKTSTAETTLPRPFGPYILERPIGGGGMGIVYEAFHRDLARRVAVKVLPRSLESNATNVERFRREARACAQVRHPNVVVVHEAGEADGHLYYAMELVEGKTLQALIDEKAVPEPRALFSAMAEVADALETLHRAGVVHRDVKPSNLIVRPDGRIVLADFGLARTFTAPGLTQTGEALGTPPYMSPEQLLGRVREVDARTDVYGLGATLYHALVGSPPFAARETQDLVRMVLAQRPDSLRSRRPELPVEVELVVLKAIEKRASDRHSTAGDLRDDLRAVAAGGAPKFRPVPAWRRAARAARTHLVPVSLAAAVLVGLGAWLWYSRTAKLLCAVDVGHEVAFFFDGRDKGVTGRGERRQVDNIEPGDHEILLKSRDGVILKRTITLNRGDTFPLVAVALPEDKLDDPRAIDERIARVLDNAIENWGLFERQRGDPGHEALPFLPRGNVRPEDATMLEVEVPGDYTESSTGEQFVIVVRDNDERDIAGPFPFSPKAGTPWTRTIPIETLRALEPGTVVHWGVRSKRKRTGELPAGNRTSFTIVSKDPSAQLSRVDEELFAETPRVRSLVRSRVYLALGLSTAAVRELLTGTPADARSFNEWASLYQALSTAGTHCKDLSLCRAAHKYLEAHETDPAFAKRFGKSDESATPAADERRGM